MAEGSVWFRDGEVFFAQSNWHSRTARRASRSRAAHHAAGARARALRARRTRAEEGRRLGEILVDEGYITDKVLEAFVSEQIQDTIFDLMRWDEGDFDFEATPEVVDEDIGLSVSIENVVMEGSRRLEEWTRIKKKIPSTDIVFKMATAPGEGTFEISLKPMRVEPPAPRRRHAERRRARLSPRIAPTSRSHASSTACSRPGCSKFASDEEIEKLRGASSVRTSEQTRARASRRTERAPSG